MEDQFGHATIGTCHEAELRCKLRRKEFRGALGKELRGGLSGVLYLPEVAVFLPVHPYEHVAVGERELIITYVLVEVGWIKGYFPLRPRLLVEQVLLVAIRRLSFVGFLRRRAGENRSA